QWNPLGGLVPLRERAYGVEFDLTLIAPFLSGGGGITGLNLEHTSQSGWNLYTVLPTSKPSEGFSVGAGVQFNFASGGGSWKGLFESMGYSFSFVGGSFFSGYWDDNPRSPIPWAGTSFGFGAGLPGIYKTETNYIKWDDSNKPCVK